MATVLAVLLAVLVVLLGPATRRALTNPASPTRRVYRAMGTENVLVGVSAAVVAFVVGVFLSGLVQATSWSWVAAESGTSGGPAVWVDLVLLVGLVQIFGAIVPGVLLTTLTTEGQKRLWPTPSLRALHILWVFAYLAIIGVPFAFALPFAVANHLVVTIVLHRMLAGFDPWLGPEAVVVGAAAREGIVVDWESAHLLKVRGVAVGLAGNASWGSLPMHGQRAVLVTAATQAAFALSIVAPVVVVRLLSVVF